MPTADDGEICVDYAAGPTPVGCMDADMACPPVVLAAAPPVGSDPDHDSTIPHPPECVMFTSGCIPEGWEECVIEDFGFDECPPD